MAQAAAPALRQEFYECDRCGKSPIEKPCSHEERRLYNDGIEVFKWQLTDAELLAYYPKTYIQDKGYPTVDCPICGNHEMNVHDKRTVVGHMGQSHPALWTEKIRDTIAETKDPSVIWDILAAMEAEVRKTK